jgi:N-acetylmuramoyl-L-alanine amidase
MPTAIPILHPPPYRIAIEPGHGGPYYWGASAYDGDGNRYIEKDLTLELAWRLNDLLLEDEMARYEPVLVRPGDYTLSPWLPHDYRWSLISEAQARVDVANIRRADVYLALHFNGWSDSSQAGAETYCNPDRSFGNESCTLASFVQQALVTAVREAGYEIRDRGVRNDAEVNGDPANQHSFVLGTNARFNPTLMPGVISEALFLSNPDDLAFLRRPEALDVIAAAYKRALNDYFAWLMPPAAGQ